VPEDDKKFLVCSERLLEIFQFLHEAYEAVLFIKNPNHVSHHQELSLLVISLGTVHKNGGFTLKTNHLFSVAGKFLIITAHFGYVFEKSHDYRNVIVFLKLHFFGFEERFRKAKKWFREILRMMRI